MNLGLDYKGKGTYVVYTDTNGGTPKLMTQAVCLPQVIHQKVMFLKAGVTDENKGYVSIAGIGTRYQNGSYILDDIELLKNDDGIGVFFWTDENGERHAEMSKPSIRDETPL